MEILERLKKKLEEEYGITTEQELLAALAEPGPDLGIFVTPLDKKEEKSA